MFRNFDKTPVTLEKSNNIDSLITGIKKYMFPDYEEIGPEN